MLIFFLSNRAPCAFEDYSIGNSYPGTVVLIQCTTPWRTERAVSRVSPSRRRPWRQCRCHCLFLRPRAVVGRGGLSCRSRRCASRVAEHHLVGVGLHGHRRSCSIGPVLQPAERRGGFNAAILPRACMRVSVKSIYYIIKTMEK